MRNFFVYLKLQLKRCFKSYISILLVTLILFAGVALTLNMLLTLNGSSESNQKLKIGIVGDFTDSYLEVGVKAIENLDNSNVYIELIELEDEKVAETLLNKKALHSYVVIPENFVSSVLYGDNQTVKYVMLEDSTSIVSILSADIVKAVSTMITNTQSGIYSALDYCYDEDVDDISDKNMALNIKYVNLALNRHNIADTTNIGVKDSLSLEGYYFCGMITLFLLIFGIAFCSVYAKKNLSLNRVLKAKGMSCFKIISGEYLAFLSFTVATILIVMTLAGFAVNGTKLPIPELENFALIDFILLAFKLLPAIFALSALQYLIYEATSNLISSVLLQFIVALGLAYISGCFYPDFFFPESVRLIASYLPSGVAFGYIRSIIANQQVWLNLALCALYTVVFLSFAILIRKRRLLNR